MTGSFNTLCTVRSDCEVHTVHTDCFPVYRLLRQLCQIRHSLPIDTFQILVVSLVLTRLDYGNSVLAGVPVYLFRRLQSVLNAAARLTCHLWQSDHISDALACFYWLRIPERIKFKIAVLTYEVIDGLALPYYMCHRPTQSTITAFCRHQSPGSAY